MRIASIAGMYCADSINASVSGAQSCTADGGDAVLDLAFIGQNPAAFYDTHTVSKCIPGTHNIFRTPISRISLREDEGTAVIRKDMDYLDHLQAADQLNGKYSS